MGKGGGAGRKTHTSSYDSGNGGKGGGGRHFMPIPNDRDLREELGGVIFGATAETMQGAPRWCARSPLAADAPRAECLEGLVFGKALRTPRAACALTVCARMRSRPLACSRALSCTLTPAARRAA